MAKRQNYNEVWVGGLSDCCGAPVKEIGSGITLLVCGECGDMCNKKINEDDDFPDDFFDNEDDD